MTVRRSWRLTAVVLFALAMIGGFVGAGQPVVATTTAVYATEASYVTADKITTDVAPTAVAVSPSGDTVWFANQTAGKVEIYSAASHTLQSIIYLTSPSALAFNSDGSQVWITNSSNKTVAVYDAATRTLVRTCGFTLADAPTAIGFPPGADTPYVFSLAYGSFVKLNADCTTMTVVNFDIALPNGSGRSFAIGANGRVWVATAAGTNSQAALYVVSGNVANLAAYWTLASAPWQIAIAPDGNRAWMPLNSGTANGANAAYIDVTSTPTFTATLTTMALPLTGYRSVAVSPDGTRVWLASGTQITIVDSSGTTPAVVSSFSRGTGGPNGLALSPMGRVVWVAGLTAFLDSFRTGYITSSSVPTSVAATASSGTATVTWSAPADDGGSAITAYKVERLDGSTWVTLTTSAGTSVLSYTDTGLQNGTTYAFRVSATNAAGTSSPAVSGTVTPFGVPQAPSTLSAIADNASALLAWTVPSGDGGSPLTGFRVETYDGTTWTAITPDFVTSVTTATVAGLTNGQAYQFRVSAVNAIGASTPTVSSAVTPFAVIPPSGGSPSAQAQAHAQMSSQAQVPASSRPAAVAATTGPAPGVGTAQPVAPAVNRPTRPSRDFVLLRRTAGSSTVAKAPVIRSTVGIPVRAVVTGLPADKTLATAVGMGRHWYPLGTARTSSAGIARTAALVVTRPGSLLLRLGEPGGGARFVRLLFSAPSS